MNFKRITIAAISAAVLLTLAVCPKAAENIGKNVQSILEQILSNQQSMRSDIDRLTKWMEVKDKEIAELKSLVTSQKAKIEEQSKAIEEQASESAPAATDFYSARMQYEVARALQHETIFNIRRGLQKPYFERCIIEFKKVVDNHPTAPEAPEAQLRIAKIYYQYLDEIDKARVEYNKLIEDYPDSRYVDEARRTLSKIGQ